MLVLSRCVGQSIKIGDDITISVVRIEKGNVRLGIEAPLDVAIVRDDVKKTKGTENVT